METEGRARDFKQVGNRLDSPAQQGKN